MVTIPRGIQLRRFFSVGEQLPWPMFAERPTQGSRQIVHYLLEAKKTQGKKKLYDYR